MDTPHCEVIGCGAQAQWFLVSQRDGQVEEQLLCQNHWRQLMADRSRRVIRWSRAGVSSPAHNGDAAVTGSELPTAASKPAPAPPF